MVLKTAWIPYACRLICCRRPSACSYVDAAQEFEELAELALASAQGGGGGAAGAAASSAACAAVVDAAQLESSLVAAEGLGLQVWGG